MIKIVLKSFFSFKIISFLKYFINNIKKKYIYFGPFFMPKKIKKFTLLVSPHVDKNARDQLQIKTYKFFFLIENFDIFLLNFLIKNKNIDGLEIYFTFI